MTNSNPNARGIALRQPSCQRILLKLSGEALMGDDSYGINHATIARIVGEIKEVVALGVQVAIVIGGGNIFRGVAPAAQGMARASADYVGMLATVMNALILHEALQAAGLNSCVQSALKIDAVVAGYSRTAALQALASGSVLVFGAGTGNPYFTTDTAAALRGLEMEAQMMLKATKVDGVYSDDPKKNPDATRYQIVTFEEAIQKNLKVMDATALTLCRDNALPITVFSIFKQGALKRVVMGEDEGTRVVV